MISIELDHALTPPELARLNQKIAECVRDDNNDNLAHELNLLIKERQECIVTTLELLSTEDKNAFAEKELINNKFLTELVHDLHNQAKIAIVAYVRGKAAIKKYE